MCGCLSCAPYWGPDLACNPSMCLDWESNWGPFGSQAGNQFTKPATPTGAGYDNVLINTYSSGVFFSLKNFYTQTYQVSLYVIERMTKSTTVQTKENKLRNVPLQLNMQDLILQFKD